MKKILYLSIISSLILVGCGKKPQPSPEEIIPEIPEPVTETENSKQEDLSDIVIPVNDGNVDVVEVANGDGDEDGGDDGDGQQL